MKKAVLVLASFAMVSCGYSIQTDNQLKRKEFEIAEISNQVDAVKEEKKELELKLKNRILRDSLELKHFKDSVEFMNLSRVICYDKREHRHSCEIFGNPIINVSKEVNNEKPYEAIYEEPVVATN